MAFMDLFHSRRDRGNAIYIKNVIDKSPFPATEINYNLSRALYTAFPIDDSVEIKGGTYQLGNFCTKTFIDTFSWYVGIPSISSDDADTTEGVNQWIRRKRSDILRIIKQSMVDGRHFVWMRLELGQNDIYQISLKQISREMVEEKESIKNPGGGYKKFVFKTKEVWTKDGIENTAEIKWTLEPGKESYEITGALPPTFEKMSGGNKTKLRGVPVFCQVNNKQSYFTEGIPEIAAAVPFIAKYDALMRKLITHVSDGLIPRLLFQVKKMRDFLKRSFALTDDQIDSGGVSISTEGMENVFLDDSSDRVQYLQREDRSTAAIKTLELLYFIMVELTMPEYLYGSAMNSTNASVGEQSPVWEKKVDGKQGEFDEFFYWMADTFIAMNNIGSGRSVFKGKVVSVVWPEVKVKDSVALMNALLNCVTALEKAMSMHIASPETAFNALKTFIPAAHDFKEEQSKAEAFTKIKLELEAIKEKLNEGDTDVGDRINALFKRSKDE